MDGQRVKSQNENEIMKTENIDKLIGDISASYDKDRKVDYHIKRRHIYEIISAHTDARLGESDIQVELIKRMKKRVLELKEIYPETTNTKIWSHKMLMNVYILKGHQHKPKGNTRIRNKTAEDSLSDNQNKPKGRIFPRTKTQCWACHDHVHRGNK